MNSPHQPWAKQSISIHLSKSRKGKLADYATGMEEDMTPAEAIYALIDTASAQDCEEFVSLSDVKAELNALRNHMDEQKKIIQECTQVLYAVCQSLDAMRRLVQEMASPSIP